ncbi:mediator of rna polymerase ii transcription subunit 1 [Holotrichia oblita]|uniref:Mediator of rna polymerase ii transcription subunit 1 n=1 Tax=Holotrichia oblita TaxID=644536 RepID=A0ACB9SV42_HOLOL|nr:mediator of rna polymerase ii transcription subunit 1 [Holotrichia oblita]
MNKLTNGSSTGQQVIMDKSKDWQLELLMEKLRSKASQFKSLTEMAKTVRMAMLEKRYALDSVEKSQHQKCLDTLQHSIKVTSLQSMVERLESLTRQLGLKFVQGPSGVELFISSDMFYLEIILDQTGAVLDVKVHHEGKIEQQSCQELVNCLSKGDFADFTAQLEGFASIYQLNAEKKVKCKAFTALQSLETDLSTLAQLQMFMKEPFNLLHKSPVGILEKRKGGHPMKLTYFVSPYDLINAEKCELEPIMIEAVISKSLGYSVTVCMEGSAGQKLQTNTLITVNKNHNGKSTPSYASLTSQNTVTIPACFVLRLNKPMPMCVALVRQIQQITELECAELTTTHPLLSLIATHTSDGKLEAGTTRGLFVTLPDQHHCYFMTENKNMDGILVHSIPFTHPSHVAQILVILRQQALFNTIISSCVRPNSKQDFENMIMFEISALSWTQISISLEHPMEESMATAEIDLSDISNLICRIHNPGTPPPPNTPDIVSETATKHLNRCFSIPVTMRSVIRYWDKQAARKNHYNGHENFNLPLGSGDPGVAMAILEPGSGAGLGHGMNLPMMSHQHAGAMFLNETIMNSANFSNFPTSSDTNSVLTNLELTNILAGTTSTSTDKPKRHKRKNEEGWKSSKRRAGDDSELLDGSSYNKVPPSVSITPIPTSASQGFSQSAGRSGIEIIPISTSPATSLPSSITITPIPTSQTKSEEKSRERKSSKSKSEDKNKLEKKRKRKREESPMGPPEKIPGKQDPLSKPVSVSIKPAESPPLPSMTPTSPSMSRKYTTSPTQSRKISSPNLLNPGIKPSSAHQSPKHSPISSSPKHTIPGISSPKSHGLSPKHPSTSGSGKPSMSTLKNAANSPSSKSGGDSSKSKSSGKESSRDKEKRTSSVFSAGNSNKKSSSSLKVKQLDLNAGMEVPAQDSLPSPSGTIDLTKNPNQARNRKGLLAVIDKLKSAHCDTATDLSSKNSKDRQQVSNKTSDSSKSNNKVGENKNSEYMVKPSSDGMKITINKTRTKDSKSSSNKSSSSGTGSPKTHTGLKPGVNSGPASKKPQQLSKSSSSSNLTNSTSSSYGNFKSISSNKSASSGSSGSAKGASSGSLVKNKTSSAADLSRTKDRPKPNKSSVFSNREGRKGSPTQGRDESDSFKLSLSKMDPYPAPLMVEGFSKQFDKKFQIPKLSARSSEEKKLKTTTGEVLNNINQTVDSKMFDMIAKNDVSLKYTIPLPSSKMFENSMENKIRNTMNNVSLTTSPKLPAQTKDQSDFGSDSGDEKSKREFPQNLTTTSGGLGKDEIGYKLNYNPISASKSFSSANANEPLSLSTKSVDLTSKFVAPAPKDDLKKDSKVKSSSEQDGLLDYSKSDKIGSQSLPASMGFPHSPSVSVHIVKSPAPSPMINPSPHSASPCITDDELMDEALVGLGKF